MRERASWVSVAKRRKQLRLHSTQATSAQARRCWRVGCVADLIRELLVSGRFDRRQTIFGEAQAGQFPIHAPARAILVAERTVLRNAVPRRKR